MNDDFVMGIVSTGMYLPETMMTAEEISEASGLPLLVVKEKLGITQKHITTPGVHPNMMAAKAANQAIEKAGIDPKEIDVLLCTTEEWKEYALWTAGIDLAEEIGATNAWGMDMHMRCATTIAAMKLARSLMRDDSSINTVMIAGGYTIADFIDFTNLRTSFLFNIGAGAGAMIVKRGWPVNHVLGTHLMSDGSMSRHVIVPASGTIKHPSNEAVAEGLFKFDLVEPEAMKNRLNDVSIDNWLFCIDEALRKSGTRRDGSPYTRDDLDFLNMLLVKPSAFQQIRELLNIAEDKSVYLGNIGHIGEQDSIISIIEGERTGSLQPGDLMVIIGAGIGYVWGAGVVQWGPAS
ncbi:MAG: 3-oxoacyl-ACP synthase [Acidimicrobiia bacterium]|nr:3-oxoacyl-ACP synthase [Acidimicrobiia bacterium]MDX2466467.1 3-oxoacyl-ACP synthase [Acidimicrobiia bacterium]